MAKKRPTLPEGDDGRTIANMDVEGMPWHMDKPETLPEQEGPPMSKREALMYAWAAVRGGLMIFLIYAVVFGLAIWFIGHIWGA